MNHVGCSWNCTILLHCNFIAISVFHCISDCSSWRQVLMKQMVIMSICSCVHYVDYIDYVHYVHYVHYEHMFICWSHLKLHQRNHCKLQQHQSITNETRRQIQMQLCTAIHMKPHVFRWVFIIQANWDSERGYPTWLYFFSHMPICPYAHMGICEKNMAKWGIP